MSFLNQSRAFAIVFLLGLSASGCGDGKLNTFPAKGVVVFPDGKPLQGGRVHFMQSDLPPGVRVYGIIGDDGAFELQTYEAGDGAPLGEYQVVVSPKLPSERDDPSPAELQRALNQIDDRYREYESSGLRFTVTDDPSKNEFRIEVTPPGR